MTTPRRLLNLLIFCGCAVGTIVPNSYAAGVDDEPQAPGTMKLADGALEIPIPKSWTKKTPRFRIIQYEFEVKSDKAGVPPLRVTVMGAGGSVDANIARWKSQFSQGAKVEQKKFEAAGQTVHLVDITGTFREQTGGPFSGAPAKLRNGYRMLGAIVVTKGKGQYFIKLVGPADAVAAQRPELEKALKNLKVHSAN